MGGGRNETILSCHYENSPDVDYVHILIGYQQILPNSKKLK